MHQPTKRVIDILEYIVKKGENVRLTDFSRELEMPKSTLLAILKTLCDYKFLVSENGRYSAGTALFSLGAAFTGNFPTLNFVRKQLDDLVGLLGETCYFGVLEEGNVLYLEKADSLHPLRMLITTGRRLPAYSTGIGKALLIDYSEDELKKIYPDGLLPYTKNTITDFGVLASQLECAKNEGYVWEIEESMEHIRCFAVPVRKNGRVVAAVSVAIPVFRYDEEKRDFIIESVKNVAQKISETVEQTDAHFGNIF